MLNKIEFPAFAGRIGIHGKCRNCRTGNYIIRVGNMFFKEVGHPQHADPGSDSKPGGREIQFENEPDQIIYIMLEFPITGFTRRGYLSRMNYIYAPSFSTKAICIFVNDLHPTNGKPSIPRQYKGNG
jgi:hypothetical protein